MRVDAENEMSALAYSAAGPTKKLLYLALCDPDLEVTGATVRMGAFVKDLARYYDTTLLSTWGARGRPGQCALSSSTSPDSMTAPCSACLGISIASTQRSKIGFAIERIGW